MRTSPPFAVGEPSATPYHRRRNRRLALVGAAAATALAWLWWRPFRLEVHGLSMEPALRHGDWAVAVAVRGRSRRGDVVVLERPDRPGLEVAKRVARETEDGWWVLGDNPPASTDSRHFGTVAAGAMRGRVVAVYWPPRRTGLVRRRLPLA